LPCVFCLLLLFLFSFRCLTHLSSCFDLQDIFTQTTTAAALSFTSPFSLTISRTPSSSTASASSPFILNSLLAHFDTYFTSEPRLCDSSKRKESVKDAEGEVFFTTGAWDTPTHWKQTMFLLKEPIEVEVGALPLLSFPPFPVLSFLSLPFANALLSPQVPPSPVLSPLPRTRRIRVSSSLRPSGR
jgi:hypothetical protein